MSKFIVFIDMNISVNIALNIEGEDPRDAFENAKHLSQEQLRKMFIESYRDDDESIDYFFEMATFELNDYFIKNNE